MTTLETDRLRIEQPNEGHFPFFTSCLTDPQLINDSLGVLSAEQIRESFDRTLEHWRKHGFGQGIGVLKKSGKPIGIYGIKFIEIEGQNYLDPSALTITDYQKMGFAQEAMAGVIDSAFKVLRFEKVTALPSGKAALKLAERAGFKFLRKVQREILGMTFTNLGLYELSRTDWENRKHRIS